MRRRPDLAGNSVALRVLDKACLLCLWTIRIYLVGLVLPSTALLLHVMAQRLPVSHQIAVEDDAQLDKLR